MGNELKFAAFKNRN